MSEISKGPWRFNGLKDDFTEDDQVIVAADGEVVLGCTEFMCASEDDLRLMSCAYELAQVALKLHGALAKAGSRAEGDRVALESILDKAGISYE
jgi:hypothetical protein